MALPGRVGRDGLWRWLLPGLATLLIVLFVVADRHLKRPPHIGFAPAEANVVVVTEDFPATWGAFDATPLADRVSEASPQLNRKIGVWLRRNTGIRWTPARWSLWFGGPAVFAEADAGSVMCVHPGLLARFAFALGRLSGTLETDGNIAQAGSAAFAWRDGFLIVGTSPAVVREVRASGRIGPSVPSPDPALTVVWKSEPSGRLTLDVGSSIRIDGRCSLQADISPPPRMLVAEWPKPPLVSLAGVGGPALVDVFARHWAAFPGSELIEDAFGEYLRFFPSGWNENTDTFALALLSVDTSEFLAVPEAALILRAGRQLQPLSRPAAAIPYRWSGVDGWMTPWLGERMSLYAASGPRLRVFANDESTMAALLGRRQIGRVTASDLSVRVDCPAVARLAKTLIRRAAEQELLGRRNVDDAERDLFPIADAIAELGVLHIEGRYDDEGLAFSGGLEYQEDADTT